MHGFYIAGLVGEQEQGFPNGVIVDHVGSDGMEQVGYVYYRIHPDLLDKLKQIVANLEKEVK